MECPFSQRMISRYIRDWNDSRSPRRQSWVWLVCPRSQTAFKSDACLGFFTPPTSEGEYRNTILKKQALVEALATILLVILLLVTSFGEQFTNFITTFYISGVATDYGGNLLEECASCCTAWTHYVAPRWGGPVPNPDGRCVSIPFHTTSSQQCVCVCIYRWCGFSDMGTVFPARPASSCYLTL